MLRIDHSRLPANQVLGHAAGWQAQLAGLAAALEGSPPPDRDALFGALLPAYGAAHPDVGAA